MWFNQTSLLPSLDHIEDVVRRFENVTVVKIQTLTDRYITQNFDNLTNYIAVNVDKGVRTPLQNMSTYMSRNVAKMLDSAVTQPYNKLQAKTDAALDEVRPPSQGGLLL